jgi:hypothetical protein
MKLNNSDISRRDFIKKSGKAILAVAALSVFKLPLGCGTASKLIDDDNGYYDNGY